MKKHQRLFAAGIIIMIILSTVFPTASAAYTKQATLSYSGIKIALDEEIITPRDANGNVVDPFLIDGTTYLPVRAVANALGMGVDWNGATKTVILSSATDNSVKQENKNNTDAFKPYTKQAVLNYNDIKIKLDGEELIPKDAKGNAVEPFTISGTTYLPVRAIATALGLTVTWDGATQTVGLLSSDNLTVPNDSTFEVHYIDVGQADSALVICDDEAMLIDGGNVEDSSKIYAYLKKLDITHLEYIVATHAHEDHVGGLAGALNYATVGAVYCPTTSYDSNAFRDFVNYVNYRNSSIAIPKAGDSFDLGSADVDILACDSYADGNDSSIVLKITYGDTSFLFTGDAEYATEQSLIYSGFDLSSTVLKVGHHGSETSTSYVFLREIMPEYAVISVGKGNSYGHPTEAVLSRLRDADVKTYRTDMQGDIICKSDGKNVTFTTNRNATINTLDLSTADGNYGAASVNQNTNTTPSTPVVPSISKTYIGNRNSKKFHESTCPSVDRMSEKNKVPLASRDDAISRGYDPCNNCNP